MRSWSVFAAMLTFVQQGSGKKSFIQNGKTLLPAAAQLSFDEDVKVKKRSLHKE